MKNLFFCLILAGLPAFSTLADHIKVDMDTRSDATAAGFSSWQPADGTSKTFGDVTINLDFLELPADTFWKINWYNKDGLNKYELAMDCLYANFDDGSTSHPSFDGGTLLMTISGLTEGTHTIITYHNAPWPVSKYGRTIAPCKIYVDGVEKLTVQPSQYVTDDADVESTFFTVQAIAGEPVNIKFEPVGDPNTQICTAVLSGFEIDNPAALESYAKDPVPTDGDEHVFANNDDPLPGSAGTGHVKLTWSPSSLAEQQDIYFGTDPNEVADANTSAADVYQGRLSGADSTWDANNLDAKDTYYWRIDTVLADGSITKGYVWKFRTRHLAFATAEGYGRFARGGRFGRVLEVTTLEDYNTAAGDAPIPGSLRYALEVEKGPRVVVFRVGGNINLTDRISIPSDGGDVYVAGQTAPGEGICITRYGFGALGAKDVIIRFIRDRVGDFCKKAMDGIGLASCDHCIVDHCSISWTIDEGHSSRSAHNITFQRNIISEALNDSYHYNDSDPAHGGTQPHAFAASISGNIGSYHHNLLAHCTQRNWSLAGGLEQDGKHYGGHVDIRNNVVYNWKSKTTDGGCKQVNFVNNYYKPGPVGGVTWLMKPDGDQLGLGDMQRFYIVGNEIVGILEPSEDNWTLVFPQYATADQIRSDVPLFEPYVETETADEAYLDVLDDVGDTRPMRDPIDQRIVSEVRNGTFTYRGSKQNLPGIIDSQEDVGGYRQYTGGPVPDDADHDGMPDWWEKWRGFDPNDPNDGNADPNLDGYTNLEDWLEYLAEGGRQLESPPQINPSAAPTSGRAPLLVHFDANALDPDGDPLTYNWNFGDANSSAEPDPNHTFDMPGDYNVCLTVSDGILEVSQSLNVQVSPAIELSIERVFVNLWHGFKSADSASLMLRADFTPCILQPDDIISASCDGQVIFKAQFSQFVQSDDDPNIYFLHRRHAFVIFNCARGSLALCRVNFDPSGIILRDGLDIELRLGAAVAAEHLTLMKPWPYHYWFYSKPHHPSPPGLSKPNPSQNHPEPSNNKHGR
jgi:hypothetical protein